MTCLLVSLLLCGLTSARVDDSRARTIAPFIDADVIAIGRLDLVKVDVDKLARRLNPDPEESAEFSRAVSPWLGALRKAGAREIYLLLVMSEVMGSPSAPPPVIVPLGEGADAKAIGELLCGGGPVKGPIAWPTCATIKGAVFAGSNDALEHLRQQSPIDRPELISAWATLGDTGAEMLLIPSSDTRRVVEEMLPNLPKELGGGPITTVSRGLSWAAISLTPEPEPQFRIVVQSRDAASARSLYELGKNIKRLALPFPEAPDLSKLAENVKAEVIEDRISLVIEGQKAILWAEALTLPVRGAAGRARCVNNLKQIALAMHNYHDRHRSFPPAYTVDKSGKPLLSWRVLILPFIEQDALYREFHLDEPWDSPHNRTLIDRMPETYRCPMSSAKRADLGKTAYLTPRGKSTVFPGSEGVKIQSITDGTSNTIFVVDASNDRAVVWTKPDDWDVEPALDLKGVFGHHPSGTNFAFADGWVRFIKDKVDPKVLEKLLTRDGGEVIGQDEF
jgi:prepilin-type processing-associated H-X9-DG protein